MRLDYNEKKKFRDGVERKPVQKNRPRREPVGLFVLLSMVALVVTFGAGVGTGWFLFKGKGAGSAPQVAASPPPKAEPVPAPAKTEASGADSQLTFYQTLPAGGKGALGSGLNLKLAEPAPRPVPAAAPSAPPRPKEEKPARGGKQEGEEAAGADQPDQQEKQQDKPEKQEAQARFLVQVASYRDKGEAEAAQGRLAAKGVAAYLVESKLPERGVWYRLRVGRHLSRGEAESIAGKTGKGSVIVPE